MTPMIPSHPRISRQNATTKAFLSPAWPLIRLADTKITNIHGGKPIIWIRNNTGGLYNQKMARATTFLSSPSYNNQIRGIWTGSGELCLIYFDLFASNIQTNGRLRQQRIANLRCDDHTLIVKFGFDENGCYQQEGEEGDTGEANEWCQ